MGHHIGGADCFLDVNVQVVAGGSRKVKELGHLLLSYCECAQIDLHKVIYIYCSEETHIWYFHVHHLCMGCQLVYRGVKGI